MAGFGIGKDDLFTLLNTEGNWRKTNYVLIEELVAGVDIPELTHVLLHVLAALPERCPERQNHLVFQVLDTAHPNTSFIFAFSGIGLCTALSTIFSQGKFISSASGPGSFPKTITTSLRSGSR